MKGTEPPALLLLYYPAVGAPQSDRSYELFATGFGLGAGFFEYLVEKVFPGKRLGVDKLDDLIDPVHAESLAGMPPSIIATAGFDILRDSAHAFAGRLGEQGTPIAYRNYPSLTHSFLQFSGVVPEAERAAVETARLFGEGIRHGLSPAGHDATTSALKPGAGSALNAAHQGSSGQGPE